MVYMVPDLEERERIAASLGIVKCDLCPRLCPYCPRLLAARPDLAWVPPSETFGPEWHFETARPESEPSFLQKAANFGRAITQHVAAGLPQTDDATVSHRLEVCHSCEHFDAARTACKVCGCNMQIKVRWAEQRCPVNKW